jgi:hypothetical protein
LLWISLYFFSHAIEPGYKEKKTFGLCVLPAFLLSVGNLNLSNLNFRASSNTKKKW